MLAYALEEPPALLTQHLRRRLQYSSTAVSKLTTHSFGDTLSPVTSSAQEHLTSELLRFL